jgi:hypothetical protein
MMKRSTLAYVLVTIGLLSGVFLAFSDLDRAAGATLLTVGIISVFLARPLAESQNRINEFTSRLVPNPWGNTRPQLFVIWGTGVALLGVALLLRLV